MSKKAIALIEPDPLLKECRNEIERLSREFEEKLKFLRKQADDAHNHCEEHSKKVWNQIEARLKETGALDKNYEPRAKNGCLSLDKEGSCILFEPYDTKRKSGGIQEFIERLMKDGPTIEL